MKKQLLLIIGLVCLFFYSNAQKGKNSKDEFTYKKIEILESKEGSLELLGSENKDNASSKSSSISGKSSSTGIGETMGELSVSLTGGANYKIPIAVPPGINGVQPEVALTYNSQSGNGLAGYGWNLSGISTISRIASTKFHDNNIDPVDYDSSDRFSLDGQRLMLKSGTYGKNGAIYQTENYSNLIIDHYNY